MANYIFKMTFPNGNIIRKHYMASTHANARKMAEREYPEAVTIEFIGNWKEN